jgi:hypothetical protein
VHVTLGRLRSDDLFQKCDKLLAGVPHGGLADDFPRLWIQGVEGPGIASARLKFS